MTSSTATVGNSSRPLPSWPGCAPGERPEAPFDRRPGAPPGASLLGGAELLREFLASSRSSLSTRAVNAWI
jgi:hypothetical protein